MKRLLGIAKAIVGGLSAGLATLSAFAADGTLSLQDWLAVAVAALAGGGFVYAVPNAAKPAQTTPVNPD